MGISANHERHLLQQYTLPEKSVVKIDYKRVIYKAPTPNESSQSRLGSDQPSTSLPTPVPYLEPHTTSMSRSSSTKSETQGAERGPGFVPSLENLSLDHMKKILHKDDKPLVSANVIDAGSHLEDWAFICGNSRSRGVISLHFPADSYAAAY